MSESAMPAPLRTLGLAILAALASLALGDALKPHPAPAAAPFEWRGVIQGQYGPQFNSAQRKRLLRFMARNGFNAYVHAPKGDPYQRTLWRDPYPAARQATFDDEVALASRLGIEWIPNVSPAAPTWSSPGDAAPAGTTPSPAICFSSESDIRQLLAKFEPFLHAGVHTVMVSLDDVKRRFSCAADAAAYGEGGRAFGRASADLLGRLHAMLLDRAPSVRLLTVTSDYRGTDDSDYLRGLRERLVPGIEVMWTGAATKSRPFTPADADAYARLIGRAPIVWENWTTNDLVTPPTRIFLGPYARHPNVAGHVAGFFFNPANQSDLNFLPLATAGEWMRHPARYRPRRAFQRQIRRLAGRRGPVLRAFAEASYSTTLRASVEAPTLRRLIHRFLRARDSKSHGGRAALRLRHHLRLAASAGRRLRGVERLDHFLRQARPFLHSVRLNARAGLLATDLLQTRRTENRKLVRLRLRRAMRRADRWPAKTFGSRAGVYGLTANVIDGYVARVRHRVR
jgi:hyaluronoglucosaminidase